nr:Uncharacterised protein [Klebsiella pneumoniae]
MAGTIELLKQSLTPGGMLLIGEPWWRKRPATAEEAIACGAQSPDDFLTLPALVAHFGELGYDVVEMVLADREGWDRYEAAKWLTMRRWLEANPHDDFAPEVRQQLTTAPLHHVTDPGISRLGRVCPDGALTGMSVASGGATDHLQTFSSS